MADFLDSKASDDEGGRRSVQENHRMETEHDEVKDEESDADDLIFGDDVDDHPITEKKKKARQNFTDVNLREGQHDYEEGVDGEREKRPKKAAKKQTTKKSIFKIYEPSSDDVAAEDAPTEEQPRKSEEDQNEVAGASGGAGTVGIPFAPNEAKQSADIFRMDVDCFDETLDYLPIKYLATVGQTCKRLSRIAGFLFNQNYPGAMVDCRSDEAKYFPQFIKNVQIDYLQEDFEYFASAQSKFRRMKELHLNDLETSNVNVESIKSTLGKISVLSLFECTVDSSTLETLINSCPNIKHLSVVEGNINGSDWLLREYPTLESFEYYGADTNGKYLTIFLKLNPNIKNLNTEASYVKFDNRSIENISLDEIRIHYDLNYDLKFGIDLLNDMYDHGLYKRLYLVFDDVLDQKKADQLVSLKGLVGITTYGFSELVTSSALNNLETLRFFRYNFIEDLNILPNHLTNLKRVHFIVASFKNLMYLISSAMRLDQIVVDEFCRNQDEDDDDSIEIPVSVNKIIDLTALNEARQNLAKGRDLKVTIFIDEKAYLATKWALKGNECGLIRLKRLGARNEFFIV